MGNSFQMIKFRINEFIELRLEDGRSNIYVNDQYFRQSKYILLKKTFFEIEQEGILSVESIDELAERFDHSLKQRLPEVIDIPAETQFWAHCSNIQTWAEHDYDSKMLHSNLSFPLLKKLVEAGDLIARKVFKEEVAMRFGSRYKPVCLFLITGGYLNFFNDEELFTLAELNREIFEDNLMHVRKEFVYTYLGDEGRILKRLEKKFKKSIDPISKKLFLELIGKNNFFVKNRKITKINLSDLHILTIPSEIFQLKSLDALSISYCALERLPRAIFKLKDLKLLALNSNCLRVIPDSIGLLRSLEVLNLSFNQLKILPKNLFDLTRLKNLHLGRNKLAHISEEISALENLIVLHLYSNKLSSLPDSIGDLRHLEQLTINQNLLTFLPIYIKRLISLKSLNLSGNNFKDINSISKVVDCLKQKDVKVYFKV